MDMHSNEYLLVHYVVFSCNSEDANMCLTTTLSGAVKILCTAMNMPLLDIEYIDDDDDD